MATLSGISITDQGTPYDRVFIRDHYTQSLVVLVIPDSIGAWVTPDDLVLGHPYDITSIKAGCQPITHGPYFPE